MNREDGCYAVKKEEYEDGTVEYVATPLTFNCVVGVGDTPEEAVAELCDGLIAYLDYRMELEE